MVIVMLGRSVLSLAALLVATTATYDVRADGAPSPLLNAGVNPHVIQELLTFNTPPLASLGLTAPPRLILFPSMRMNRPVDVPAPKAMNGVAVAFDW